MSEIAPALILSASGVTKRFGGLLAVNEVDFDIPEGSIVSLIGPNGAGKTTFFNVVAGLYEPWVGPYTPATTLKKGVLPAPLGPIRLTMDPSGMLKSTPFTATRPQNRFVTPLAERIKAGAISLMPAPRPRSTLRPPPPIHAAPASARGSGTGPRAAAASSTPGLGRTAGTGTGRSRCRRCPGGRSPGPPPAGAGPGRSSSAA